MVSINQVVDTLFTFTKGKFVLFVILFLIILSFLLIIPTTKREKDPKTGKSKIVYTIDTITKRKKPVTKSYPIWGVIVLSIAIIIFGYNYSTPQSPSFTHTPEIVMGNQSTNISSTNTERLQYLSQNFVIVKLSHQDTPSLWDIDDLNVDNNREQWKILAIEPYWDCHIASDGTWTWIHVELYYPRNGANPIGEKHSHDFEEINFYYIHNNTIPEYVSFPLFTGFTEHPHELLHWYEMPRLDEKYVLRLDPNTNAFHENYDIFPTPNKNVVPTFVSADIRNLDEYLSTIEKTIVYTSFISIVITALYMFFANKYRHKYFLLIFILIMIMLYPLLSLQYDFVQGASFRVWEDGEKPDDEPWYESTEGRAYIDGYGGLPYDRSRWTEPRFDTELGIDIGE